MPLEPGVLAVALPYDSEAQANRARAFACRALFSGFPFNEKGNLQRKTRPGYVFSLFHNTLLYPFWGVLEGNEKEHRNP